MGHRYFAAGILATVAVALPAWAQDAGWYIGGEAGWAYLADEPAKAVIPVYGPRSDNEIWENGFVLGARLGYAWGNWRLEEEFRGQHNAAGTFSRAAASGEATSYAAMTNLIYDFAQIGPVRPHVGAGIGAVVMHESIKTAGFSNGVVAGTDTEFGYQAIGGIGYAIAPALEFDVDYRYLAAAAPRFHTPPAFVDGGVPAGNLSVGSGYHTHDFVVSLIYQFDASP